MWGWARDRDGFLARAGLGLGLLVRRAGVGFGGVSFSACFGGCPSTGNCFNGCKNSCVPPRLRATVGRVDSTCRAVYGSQGFVSRLQHVHGRFRNEPAPVSRLTELSSGVNANIRLCIGHRSLGRANTRGLGRYVNRMLLTGCVNGGGIVTRAKTNRRNITLTATTTCFKLRYSVCVNTISVGGRTPGMTEVGVLNTEIIRIASNLRALGRTISTTFTTCYGRCGSTVCYVNSIMNPRPFPVVIHSFRDVINVRTERRFLSVANRLPSTIITYINNNSGTVNLFSNFLGSPISVCNIRPLNENVGVNSRTTDLACNRRNVVRNFGDVVLGSRGNSPTPMCSITDNLSCPSYNPRRTFLRSLNEIGCSIIASSRAVGTFFRLSEVRNVVPTVRDSRTITCNVGLTGSVNGNSILVGLSKENSGSVSCVVRGCNVQWRKKGGTETARGADRDNCREACEGNGVRGEERHYSQVLRGQSRQFRSQSRFRSKCYRGNF